MSLVRLLTKTTDHIINMTSEPIHLYEDASGKIVTFFPSVRSFCNKRIERVFPKSAYYVFTPDKTDDILWFLNYCGNVAVIVGSGVGHDGVEVVNLSTFDRIYSVKFRKKRV